jgi:hypothetical protein
MKAQSETTARCRKKLSSSGRLHPQSNIRQQHSVSALPTPAIRAQSPFTTEEHLRVQSKIEERAHRFWFAKGCALKNALDDWLKAEAEVLAEFAKTLTQHQQMQSASAAHAAVGGRLVACPSGTMSRTPSISFFGGRQTNA